MVVIIICFGSRGSQVRILLPRHRKPRSYRNVTPFFVNPHVSQVSSRILGAVRKTPPLSLYYPAIFVNATPLSHLVLSICCKKHSEHCCHFPDFGKTLKKRRILFDNLHVIIHLHSCEYVCRYS